MTSEVTTFVSYVPVEETAVTLTMSVPELAGLLALHYKHGGGSLDGVRGKIERGLYEAADLLGIRRRVCDAAYDSSLRAYTLIDQEFAS